MKNKKVIRLFTAMLAVVLCMTAFSVTAFAGGGDGDYYTGEPAETTPEPTEEPATGGMEPEGQPLTPEGNATLVDDYYGDKQLITVLFQMQKTFVGVHYLFQVDVLFYDMHERVFGVIFFVHTDYFIQCNFSFYYDGSKNTTCEITAVRDKVNIRIKTVLQLLQRLLDFGYMLVLECLVNTHVVVAPTEVTG